MVDFCTFLLGNEPRLNSFSISSFLNSNLVKCNLIVKRNITSSLSFDQGEKKMPEAM